MIDTPDFAISLIYYGNLVPLVGPVHLQVHLKLKLLDHLVKLELNLELDGTLKD